MPQRRVAATGFGGAAPGVSILSGMAQGHIEAQKRRQEQQREAVLNRLSNAQTERILQSTRQAQEKHQENMRQMDQMEQAANAFVGTLRGNEQLVDRLGIDPSELEDMGMAGVKMVRQRLASLGELEGIQSSELQQASTSQEMEARGLEIQNVREGNRAMEIAADPLFQNLATDPDMDPGLRMQIIKPHLRHTLRQRGESMPNDRVIRSAVQLAQRAAGMEAARMGMGAGRVGSEAEGEEQDVASQIADQLVARHGANTVSGASPEALQSAIEEAEALSPTTTVGQTRKQRALQLLRSELAEENESGSGGIDVSGPSENI